MEHIGGTDARSKLVSFTIVVAVAVVLLGTLAIPVSAGDEPAVVSSDPQTLEAEPGETIEVDIYLESHGGYGLDSQVESVRLLALGHPEYLTVTNVEPGTWLEDGQTEVRTATTIGDDGAVAEVVQYRDPAAGGTINDERFASLTVSVSEDAPPSTAVLEFDETGVMLTDGYPQPAFDESLIVEIDGGGDRVEPVDPGDLYEFGHAETFAETGDGSNAPDELEPPGEVDEGADSTSGSGDGDSTENEGDSDSGLPLFVGVGAAVLVVVGTVVWAMIGSETQGQN